MGQYDQAIASLYNQLQSYSQGGNVDLTNRPKVSAQDMRGAGYDVGDGYATTYTGTYTNPEGTLAGNFTPIQANNGLLQRILSQDEMTRYAEGVMQGQPDTLGLQIGTNYQGSNAIQNAESDANKYHYLQEVYNALLNQAHY